MPTLARVSSSSVTGQLPSAAPETIIDFLAARSQLGVALGEKETAFIVKGYVQLGPVTAFVFNNHIENPFPQASAIVHTSRVHRGR